MHLLVSLLPEMQSDGIHAASSGDVLSMIQPGQHATVVMLVLGAAMAAAIWVPNVEFIFGRCTVFCLGTDDL